MPNLFTDSNGVVATPAMQTLTVEDIAAAGSVIANATAIGSSVGLSIVSGADTAKGVILPAARKGKMIAVYSSVASSGLLVYPPVNGTINDGSANASIAIEGKSLALFIATTEANWAAIYTANA